MSRWISVFCLLLFSQEVLCKKTYEGVGRTATPEEIAGPVAFLASDCASYLYGEILSVNGGAVMVG